ncbi:hypothetical protein LK994_00920 [Ferruginibacter lapsinanis]|uniref:hypothetical protein n=1 Tax=Ferruginibacter lapsinanis TaxID=563172 RepID=UPI001E2D7F1B|nr:hypothetical protein [Ferruginibacter lapsinanis]UEG50035.1 hypothetical protein LK994_00920 [Ferruginibacter lapsinanis]
MIHVINHFAYSPDGENGGSSENNDQQKTKVDVSDAEHTEKTKQKKTLWQKIREALQDWSNSDQRDLEYDDTKV